ncbi:hypothetical protein [Kribbella sp. NPDC051718]|uniref:hypothetical protein n=1 Tax=Kribbella sp. NPDC051718 TaxID=3155168 RepID=UPI003426676F
MFSASRKSVSLFAAVTMAALPLNMCSQKPNKAEVAAVEGWLGKAGKLDDPFKDGSFKVGDDVFRNQNKSLTETINELPTPDQINKVSPELQNEINAAAARVRSQLKFYDDVTAVSTAMAQQRVSATQELPQLIDSTSTVQLTEEAKDVLLDFSKDVLQEKACELAWKYYMQQNERDAVAGQLNTGTIKLSYLDQIQNQEDMTTTIFLNAIAGAARSRFSYALAWQDYANGLRKKAYALTGQGKNVITHPNGGDITFGLLYSIGGCTKSPAP